MDTSREQLADKSVLRSDLYLDVRYYETDQMGIVHHSNYIRYFECGRMAMLDEVGLPMHKIEEMGIMMPIIAVECRYKFPAKLGDAPPHFPVGILVGTGMVLPATA